MTCPWTRCPPGWGVRLDPHALTPDPTHGKEPPPGEGISHRMEVFPWRLVGCSPPQEGAQDWADRCDGEAWPGDLTLHPGPEGTLDLIVDFGTELEARVCLDLEVADRVTVMLVRGEFLREVEEHFPSAHPPAQVFWHLPSAGLHTHRTDPRGFRFVRLRFLDLQRPVSIRRLAADSEFMFRQAVGGFRCSDRRFQRAWQSSLYTARLCTRPDSFWDGIKRDRIGWFGDARITKLAVDAVYHDPRPSHRMLAEMPTHGWVNGVPVFSFDAVLMLRDHALVYGLGRVP